MKVVRWSEDDVVRAGVAQPPWYDVELGQDDWPAKITLHVIVDTDSGPAIAGLLFDPASGLTPKLAEKLLSTIRDQNALLTAATGLAIGTRHIVRDQADQGVDLTWPSTSIETATRWTEQFPGLGEASRPQRRRVMSRDLLSEVARVYRDAYAHGRPPTQAVGGHFGVSHRTAARWVSEARKAGVLGPADSTRPGESV